jgi:hypothetical protein
MVLLKNFFAQDTTVGFALAVVATDGQCGTLAAGCMGMKRLNFQILKSVGFALPTLKMGEIEVKEKAKQILPKKKAISVY